MKVREFRAPNFADTRMRLDPSQLKDEILDFKEIRYPAQKKTAR